MIKSLNHIIINLLSKWTYNHWNIKLFLTNDSNHSYYNMINLITFCKPPESIIHQIYNYIGTRAYHGEYPSMPSRPPPAGALQDRTVMPQYLAVLHSLIKNKCKNYTSCPCRAAYQLCTSGCPLQNWFNQTNRQPIPRARQRVGTIARPPTNGGRYYGGRRWVCPGCLPSRLSPQQPENLYHRPKMLNRGKTSMLLPR